MKPVLNVEELYIAVDRKRRGLRISFQDVAEQSGTHKSLLTRLGRGQAPSVDNLIRLMLWIGTTDIRNFVAGRMSDVLTNAEGSAEGGTSKGSEVTP